jgi:hypothetical protein
MRPEPQRCTNAAAAPTTDYQPTAQLLRTNGDAEHRKPSLNPWPKIGKRLLQQCFSPFYELILSKGLI